MLDGRSVVNGRMKRRVSFSLFPSVLGSVEADCSLDSFFLWQPWFCERRTRRDDRTHFRHAAWGRQRGFTIVSFLAAHRRTRKVTGGRLCPGPRQFHRNHFALSRGTREGGLRGADVRDLCREKLRVGIRKGILPLRVRRQPERRHVLRSGGWDLRFGHALNWAPEGLPCLRSSLPCPPSVLCL